MQRLQRVLQYREVLSIRCTRSLRRCISIIFAVLAGNVFAIDSASQYLSLPSDYLITSNSFAEQVVLNTSISVASSTRLFLESDGRFFPYLQNGLATMEIRVNGRRISNAIRDREVEEI